MLRVDDFNIVIGGDITGCDRARTLAVQNQFHAITGMHADRHTLEVEQDLDHVFLHAGNAGVVVEHAFDLGFNDGSTRHARQQHAAQGIAERVPEASLQGLDDDAGAIAGFRLDPNAARLQKFADGWLHVEQAS